MENDIYPEAMLTTVDNEWDPFDNFAEWYSRDLELARQQERRPSSGYLAIIAACSDDLSDNEFNQVMNDAIDEIVALDISGTFKKVTREPKEVLVEEEYEPA
jgi:hypothetical protein